MGHIAGWMKEVEVSGFIVSGRTEVGHLTLAANIVSVVALRYIRACGDAAVTNIIRVTNLVTAFLRVSTFFSITDHVVVNCWISDCFNSPVAITVEGGGVRQVYLHRFC